MSYGRHQSFFLKKHWINKGIKALHNYDEGVLVNKEKYKELGIGKNMHQALRYWMEAVNVAEYNREDRTHHLTRFGELIEKYDPSCFSYFTLAMVQFFLTKDYEDFNRKSHTFHWFFNKYEDSYITKERFLDELQDYSNNTVSPNTLNRDIDCLFQTYTKGEKSHPEDKNVSLLADLDLLRKEKNTYRKSSPIINEEIAQAFYYVINEYKEEIDLTVESVTENVGCMYNLSRTQVIEIIELLHELGYPIEITRTHNLDTIEVNDSRSQEEILDDLFGRVFNHEN